MAVSVAHPKNPVETLRKMMQAAAKAWGTGKPEVWRDPRRFRRWLASRGLVTADVKQVDVKQVDVKQVDVKE